MFYIVITACMISWWDLANSQQFCSIVPQPSCRWIIWHSSCYLFQFKILDFYAQDLVLGVLAHLCSPLWELKKVLGSNPVVCKVELYQPLANELDLGGLSMACQVGSAVEFQKTKNKICNIYPGFP